MKSSPASLKLSDFDFSVPEPLVAQTPLVKRDHSRLLVREANGTLNHSHITMFPDLLPQGTLLILNDSKVIASRIFGQLKTGGGIELFLLRPAPEERGSETTPNVWTALGRPLKKLKPGTEIYLQDGLVATVVGKTETADGQAYVSVKFEISLEDLYLWLEQYGHIPLPPYIRRPEQQPAPLSPDQSRYQTVYAQEKGSVAAPTAGLHFTPDLLHQISEKNGVEIRYVSLHVGAGTFLPVKASQPADHSMHWERYNVPSATIEAIIKAKLENRPVVAIGTTTFRCLEALYREAKGNTKVMQQLANTWRETDIFIFPTHAAELYRPWVIDGLLTNFHQPCSTLFMLVSALIGLGEAKKMYHEAIEEKYRFFSYGDATLLWL